MEKSQKGFLCDVEMFFENCGKDFCVPTGDVNRALGMTDDTYDSVFLRY